ncbi:MAG: hypothetical protein FE044_03520 [Thermoplasmata archaeon]|nr:MAG: hypothetical protein FE044_03520 [Thermoplasmata archaeon]
MKIYVEPRPDMAPTIPSWFSEQLPLSFDLAMQIGKFRRKMESLIGNAYKAIDYLIKKYGIDEKTAMAIISYFEEQSHFIIPHDRRVVVEIFEKDGYRYIIFHTLVGRRANDALSRIFAYRITKKFKFNVRLAITDNGFAIIYPWWKYDISDEELKSLFKAKNMEEDLEKALANTEILKRRFRHVATRSLMILKNYLGHEMSVSRQQKNASMLFKVVREIDPEFPALKETYREIMEDSMDIKNAKKYMKKIEEEKIEIRVLRTMLPSPFSFNIVAIGATDVVLMEDRKELIRELHKEVMQLIKNA